MQMISPTPDSPPDFSVEGFSVREILDQRAFAMRKRRKRVRTRAALIAAAARELERVGYEALTVEGISEAAGMARGTFYLYYKSRSEIMSVIMRFYWVLLGKYRPRGGTSLPLEQSVAQANTFLVRAVARNAQLLLARETLMTENQTLSRRMIYVNDLWAEQVVRAMTARGLIPQNDDDAEFHHLRARAMISMSDVLLRDIYRAYDHTSVSSSLDLNLVIRALNDLWSRFMRD